MNVRDIVKEYLQQHGYDGLFRNGPGCGCGIDVLMLCQEACDQCEPGYKVPCNPDTCELGGGCAFHIGPKKESIYT